MAARPTTVAPARTTLRRPPPPLPGSRASGAPPPCSRYSGPGWEPSGGMELVMRESFTESRGARGINSWGEALRHPQEYDGETKHRPGRKCDVGALADDPEVAREALAIARSLGELTWVG